MRNYGACMKKVDCAYKGKLGVELSRETPRYMKCYMVYTWFYWYVLAAYYNLSHSLLATHININVMQCYVYPHFLNRTKTKVQRPAKPCGCGFRGLADSCIEVSFFLFHYIMHKQ